MIGCDCEVCRSMDPHDTRLRSSVYVTVGDMRILIDTSPDLRQQALRENIRRVDAILITHAHVDHLFGLDEVRRINTIQGGGPIPLYAASQTLADIRRIFDYVFGENIAGTYRPKLDLVPADAPFALHPANGPEVSVTPFEVVHGHTVTLGYRLDHDGASLAYMPDCASLPDSSRDVLHGLDVLVLDALRHRPHPTHLTIAQSLAIVADLTPRRAFLTHICHDHSHAAITAELDALGLPHVRPAYDGLEIDIG